MNKNIFFSIIVIVCFTFITGCSGPEAKKMKFFEKAKALYEKGDYVHARLELKNAIQVDPKFASGYYYLGLVEVKTFDFNKALTYFTKAIEFDNSLWQAELELGRLYLAAKASDKAIEKAELVLLRAEENLQAIQIKAAALLQKNELTTADNLLKKLIEKGHTDADTYLLLVNTAIQAKDLEEAKKLLEKGLISNPNSVKLLSIRSGLLMLSGNYSEAEIVLKRIMEIEPEESLHLFNLIDFYWQTGRKKEALQHIDTTVNKAPNNIIFRIQAARFLQNRDEFYHAESILTSAPDGSEKNWDIQLALSELYLQQNQLDKVKILLKKCQMLATDDENLNSIKVQSLAAKTAMLEGDFETAEKLVTDILQINANNADAHFIKGKMHLIKWENQAAIKEFKDVIALMPRLESAYINLAQAYFQNNESQLELKILKQAVENLPDSEKLRQFLAEVHMTRKEYASAEIQLRRILDFHPLNSKNYLALGDFLANTKQYDKAEKTYQKLIEMSNGDSQGYIKLSQVYTKQGKLQDAFNILNKAYLKNKADSDELLTELVQICVEQENYSQALSLCNQRLSKNTEDNFALNLRGVIYTKQKRYQQAQLDFDKAISLSPKWFKPYFNLARLEMEKGDIESAISRLESALQLNPADIDPYLILTQIYTEKNAHEKVKQVYEKALNVHPDMWTAANNLAFHLAEYMGKSENLNQALTLIRRAQFYNPLDPFVKDTLAWIFYKQGKIKQALTIMENVLIQMPENPIFNYHIGTILAKSGLESQAREKLAIALESKEEFIGKKQAQTLLNEIDKNRSS